MGRAHPNTWTFLEFIIQIENAKGWDLLWLEDGISTTATDRTRYLRLDACITAAEAHLAETNNIERFLRYLGHTTNNLQRLFDPANANNVADHEENPGDIAIPNQPQQPVLAEVEQHIPAGEEMAEPEVVLVEIEEERLDVCSLPSITKNAHVCRLQALLCL